MAQMQLSPITIVAGVAVFISVVAAFVLLIITGHNTDPLVNFLTDKLVTAVGAVAALFAYNKAKQVETNTNGTTTALTETNRQLATAVANSIPTSSIAPVAPIVVAPVPPIVPPTGG